MNSLVTLVFALAAQVGGDGGNSETPHDPPELRVKPAVVVRGLDVKLGDLCQITPIDATTQAIADVRFGPAPLNGYSRTVSRQELVRALAVAGVPIQSVRLTGVDEVVVQGVTNEVPRLELIDAATAALQAQLRIEGGDVEFEAPTNVRRIQAPPGRVSQDLRARVRGTQTGPTSAVVDVEILIDGESFKKVPVTFQLQRYQRVLKTSGALEQGTPLGPQNVQLVREPMAQANGMYLTDLEQVTGMTASRRLRGQQLLTLGDIEPPALVHKGDIVTVVLSKGRVRLTARAIAAEDAPLGGRITLINRNTRAPIVGVVHGPGVVVVNH